MELPERDFLDLIKKIEGNELFVLLTSPPPGLRAAVRRRPFQGASWSYPGLDASRASQAGGTGAWWGLIEERKSLISALEMLGPEKFQRFFLSGEPYDSVRLSDECGLDEKTVREVADFADAFLLSCDENPPTADPGLSARCVARVEREGRKLWLSYLHPRYARGGYEIEYGALEEYRLRGLLSGGRWQRLQSLLRQMQAVNLRQTALHGALRIILERQAAYLRTGDTDRLEELTQREAAAELRIAPSTLSRALRGRSLRTPWDREEPLDRFFPGRRERVLARIRNIVEENAGLPDRELAALAGRKLGQSMSRRTLNRYRQDLGLRRKRELGIGRSE